jgi:hypothetical protein
MPRPLQDRFEAAANGEDDGPQGTPLKKLPVREPPKIQKSKHRKSKSKKQILFDNSSAHPLLARCCLLKV